MKGVSSMSSEGLDSTIEQVAKEKGIEKRVLVETMEAAILKAAQSVFGQTRELEARYNPDIGQVDLFQYMTVVEEVAEPERQISLAEVTRRKLDAELGEELGFQVFWRPEDANRAKEQDREYGDLLKLKQGRMTFGRIAAQNAKQVLLQRMRDAERDLIFDEYKDKKGELIRGIVRRFEKGNNIIVDIGRTEGILSFKEQTPRETYRPGDRIVAYVKDIDREARGPQVILSRSDPRLVEKLFEAEVPEIYEGIVRIVAVAREPGARSKIAVTSRDTDVDPVGACVGMKGARVQAVVQELRGEKIDIVHKVIMDESDNRMELVVPDEKLSLAIGRKGQNVRLAAQLTQWKLNIYSESKFRQMEEEAIGSLSQMQEVSDAVAKALYRQGFRALEEISEASVEELATIQGVGGPEAADRLRKEADATLERLRLSRVNELAVRVEPPTERERLLMVRGVGERTANQLEEAGYKSVGELLREDEDRLAIRTGLRIAKVRILRAAAKDFLANEKQMLAEARKALQPEDAV
jgi:N utilization substance protein A